MDTNLLKQLLTEKRAPRTTSAQLRLGGGRFEGKTGTTRRSRKGRTYHAPNGYVEYVPTLEQWQRLGLCGGRK